MNAPSVPVFDVRVDPAADALGWIRGARHTESIPLAGESRDGEEVAPSALILIEGQPVDHRELAEGCAKRDIAPCARTR